MSSHGVHFFSFFSGGRFHYLTATREAVAEETDPSHLEVLNGLQQRFSFGKPEHTWTTEHHSGTVFVCFASSLESEVDGRRGIMLAHAVHLQEQLSGRLIAESLYQLVRVHASAIRTGRDTRIETLLDLDSAGRATFVRDLVREFDATTERRSRHEPRSPESELGSTAEEVRSLTVKVDHAVRVGARYLMVLCALTAATLLAVVVLRTETSATSTFADGGDPPKAAPALGTVPTTAVVDEPDGPVTGRGSERLADTAPPDESSTPAREGSAVVPTTSLSAVGPADGGLSLSDDSHDRGDAGVQAVSERPRRPRTPRDRDAGRRVVRHDTTEGLDGGP